MPCKSFCRATSPLSQSFHREILPPFLIVSLLISFAKPFWLWMYSSIYSDWQWPSKRTLTLLPHNLLESAVIQWSVCLNSLWLYCSLFLIWVFPPYLRIWVFPSCLLFSSLYPSPLLNLVLQILWKHSLEGAVVWQLALLVRWWKSICTGRLLEQRPLPILPAECPPSSDHMRLLPKIQEWTDHQYQCIQMYMITSNSLATFSAEQSLRRKDAQSTIRLFCFSASLAPHSLSFPTCFLF